VRGRIDPDTDDDGDPMQVDVVGEQGGAVAPGDGDDEAVDSMRPRGVTPSRRHWR
jgi:hypothetical protein